MKIRLAYGQKPFDIELPDDRAVVIEPRLVAGVPEERAAVLDALDHPVGSPPLRDRIPPGAHVCVVFTDITRATPNDRLIPWLLEYLSFVPREQVLLLNSTGSHRPNTDEELARLLTPGVTRSYRVLNHEAENRECLAAVGTLSDGTPALLNRHLIEADLRIITGFIEPHFFAGFSGGPKGIIPGVAGLETIQRNHGPHHIGHVNAAFGVTEGNPIWEELRDVAARVGPSFLLNVSLNHRREITGVFAGDLIGAHRVGIEFVRQSAMRAVDRPFDVVVTTNSGHPLDLNLYQGIKGLSAGARILKPGGLLILACECREGTPRGSAYDRLLRTATGPDDLLSRMAAPGFSWPEQWQAQIQARIQQTCRTQLFSTLSDSDTRAAYFEPCRDIVAAVMHELERLGPQSQVALLPQGPLTIPYLP
jgi:nickel-dependent lactate racemase